MEFFTVMTANFPDGLNKDTPAKRPTLLRNGGEWLKSMPRLGGINHRYSWPKAA
jgi:hypothetical protein